MLITIGRQYGAGGREVAEILAKEFQMPLYDRRLVALVAEHLEKGCKLEDLNLSYQNLYGDESPYEFLFDNLVQNDDMFIFRPQADAILKLADYTNSGVFVGRCSNYILKDKNSYNFFIVADDKFREQRGKEVYHQSLSELKKEDDKRAAYYNYYTGSSWGDPTDYDLIINVSKCGIKGAVSLIKSFIATNPK